MLIKSPRSLLHNLSSFSFHILKKQQNKCFNFFSGLKGLKYKIYKNVRGNWNNKRETILIEAL